jgi:hypothetical protein
VTRSPCWIYLLDPPAGSIGDGNRKDTGLPSRAVLHVLDAPVRVAADPATSGFPADIVEGSYVLRVESPGHRPQEEAVEAHGDFSEDFVLNPAPAHIVRESSRPCGPSSDQIDITTPGRAFNLVDDASQYVSLGIIPVQREQLHGSLCRLRRIRQLGRRFQLSWWQQNPCTFLPSNAIDAFWDDLNPASELQGTICAEMVDWHFFVLQLF